MRQRNWSSHYP